jgi:nitrogen fixation protein NifU and related proteins
VTSPEIYQEALLALARSGEGKGELAAPAGRATLDNPLCGDQVTFEVELRGNRITALARRVRGCVLCEASAALLARAALGASRAEVKEARSSALAVLSGEATRPAAAFADLALFTPVREVPSRHRCVLLPFDALGEALVKAGR